MAGDPQYLFQNYPAYEPGVLEQSERFTVLTPLPDPVVEFGWGYSGYEFAGWNTSRDGSGTTYNIGDFSPWDPLLYAIWSPESSITDLTGTTWVINEVPDITSRSVYFIDFTYNDGGGNYNGDALDLDDGGGGYLGYDDDVVYTLSDGWQYPEIVRTISITGGTDVTNASLIAWLEANAVQQGGGDGACDVKVIYNNQLIRNSTTDDTFTLPCNGKIMATDIVIQATDVSNLTATYGGVTILSTSGTVTKTLTCGGKVMADDIGVSVTAGGAPAYPVKGDVINIDMNGDGTDEQYRVLNINGSVAEVLAQFNTGITGGGTSTSNQRYGSSPLDTYYNTTWYNTCSATAKAAIVDKTITQDAWHPSATGKPDYVLVAFSQSTQISCASPYSNITRHVYAVSIQDIIDYLGATPEMTASNTTLTYQNIRDMYGNAYSGFECTRTRSANYDITSKALFYYDFSRGSFLTTGSSRTSYNTYPCFQIDLDKIAWSKV